MSAPASVTPTPVAPAAESSTAAENSTGRAPLGSHGWKRCMRFVDYSLKHCKSRAQAMARDGNCCTRSLPAAAPRIHALLRKIEGRGCQLATSPVVCEDRFAGLPMVGAFDPRKKSRGHEPSSRRRGDVSGRVGHAQSRTSLCTRMTTVALRCACVVPLTPPPPSAHPAPPIHSWTLSTAATSPARRSRAANLSGDCDFGADLMRGGFTAQGPPSLAAHQQRCVRRRAERSLRAHPQCLGDGGGRPAPSERPWARSGTPATRTPSPSRATEPPPAARVEHAPVERTQHDAGSSDFVRSCRRRGDTLMAYVNVFR